MALPALFAASGVKATEVLAFVGKFALRSGLQEVVRVITGGIFGGTKNNRNKASTAAALDDIKLMVQALAGNDLRTALNKIWAFSIHAGDSASIRAQLLSGGDPGLKAWQLIGFIGLKAQHMVGRINAGGSVKRVTTFILPGDRVLSLDQQLDIPGRTITLSTLRNERNELQDQLLGFLGSAESALQNNEGQAAYDALTPVVMDVGQMVTDIWTSPVSGFDSVDRAGTPGPTDVGHLINGIVDFIHHMKTTPSQAGAFIRDGFVMAAFVFIGVSGYVPETRKSWIASSDFIRKRLQRRFNVPFPVLEPILDSMAIAEIPTVESISGTTAVLPVEPKYATSVKVRPPSRKEQLEDGRRTITSTLPSYIKNQDPMSFGFYMMFVEVFARHPIKTQADALSTLLGDNIVTLLEEGLAKEVMDINILRKYFGELIMPIAISDPMTGQIIGYIDPFDPSISSDGQPIDLLARFKTVATRMPTLEELWKFIYPDIWPLFFPSGVVNVNDHVNFLLESSMLMNRDETGLNTRGTEFNPGHLALIAALRSNETGSLPHLPGGFSILMTKIARARAIKSDIIASQQGALNLMFQTVLAQILALDGQIRSLQDLLAQIGALRAQIADLDAVIAQLTKDIDELIRMYIAEGLPVPEFNEFVGAKEEQEIMGPAAAAA